MRTRIRTVWALGLLLGARVAWGEDALDALLTEEASKPPSESAASGAGAESEPTTSAPRTSAAIEEIVVTAQKRTQSLQDVPISMAALDQTAIDERGIGTFEDLTFQVTSFQFGEVAGSGQASIRGVGFSLVSGTGEGSVAVHTDGLFLSRPGQTTMLQQDVAKIEILRGPQGTLYGRNATGGVVNFITPAPPAELESSITVGAGTYDQKKGAAHVGGGLLDDRVRVRLSGSWDERDDHFENVEFPGRDQGGREQLAGRFSMDVDATDFLRFELRPFHVDEDLNGILYAAYRPPPDAVLAPPGTYSDDPYEIRTNDAGVTNRRMTGGSLKTIVEIFDAFTISATTGYIDYQFTTDRYDGDGTSTNIFTVWREENSETFTQELIVNWKGPRLEWLVGGFVLDERFTQTNDAVVDAAGVASAGASSLLSRIAPGTDPVLLELAENVNIANDSEEESFNYAFFSDATYSLTDRWRLFGGLRWLKDTRDHLLQSSTIVETPVGEIPNHACEADRQSFDVDELTGRLGAQWDALEDAMLYGQLSTGFKSGGFAKATCGNSFEPEKVRAAETGWKSFWLSRRLQLNGAVFAYDYDNLQVEEIVFPQIHVENAQARVFGLELESSMLLPIEGLEASLRGTLLRARYTEFLNADNAEGLTGGPVEDLEGNVLNRSPTFAGGASLQYTLGLGGWGSLVSLAEATYSTKFALRAFNRDSDFQPAHEIVNVHVNYFSPSESLRVRGFVKNATDQPVLMGLLGIAGYKAATWGLPRTAGVEVSYLWP